MDKGKGNYSYHTLVTWVYFRFLTTGLATMHLCCSGPEICFHTYGLLYIRFPYNRKILSNNKEQLCRDPACPFHTSRLRYIRCFLHPVYTVFSMTGEFGLNVQSKSFSDSHKHTFKSQKDEESSSDDVEASCS